MHCTLSFGSIGARAKSTGVPSHHHTAAIAPRDIRKSISGMPRETSSPCRNDSLGFLKRDTGRLKNHRFTLAHAITHKVCFFSLWRRVASLQCAPARATAEKGRGEIEFVRRSLPSRFQDSCKLDPNRFLSCAGTGPGIDRQLLRSIVRTSMSGALRRDPESPRRSRRHARLAREFRPRESRDGAPLRRPRRGLLSLPRRQNGPIRSVEPLTVHFRHVQISFHIFLNSCG